MPVNVKALIVVLLIGAAIFHFARPIALRFGRESDFVRRRNVWIVLTAAGFVAPSFWLFALVAIPVLAWGGRKDANPVAFYLLMLHVIPVVDVPIPVIGIESLFSLDIYRLLSLFVLIPALWRLRRSQNRVPPSRLAMMDAMLIGYGVLEVLLALPADSPTATLRHIFLFFIDVYVVYFAVSRLCTKRAFIVEAQAAFCISCALMAAIAAFESARHWLLYADLAGRWGIADFLSGLYLVRGDSLRAVASSGNTLALGYLLAIGFGFWLYLQSHVQSVRVRVGVAILYWIGLFATYSKGPWLGALVIYFSFAALGPRAMSRVLKSVGVAAALLVAISFTPLGSHIAQILPFMGGTVDPGSIAYRQRLAARAWALFQENPWFGDNLVLLKMEDLRQGVGLIDLVNTYAEVVLYDGLVGLTLFLGLIVMALVKTYRLAKRAIPSDADLGLLGASLASCIVGTLVMIGTSSLFLGYQKMFYVLAGLAAAYSCLAVGGDVLPGTEAPSANHRDRRAAATAGGA